MLGVIEHMGLKLFGREVIFEKFKPISTRYLNVTDGRTDGQTDRRLTVASPRSALASRGKNAVKRKLTYAGQVEGLCTGHKALLILEEKFNLIKTKTDSEEYGEIVLL